MILEKIGYFFLILISKIPFYILYGISNCLYVLLYYVIGYRKKIVRENLKNSFPEKSEHELRKIEKKFYRNFTDYALETVKMFSITEEIFEDRMKLENVELLEEIKNKKRKDVMLLSGHMFNWEWLAGKSPKLPQENSYTVYRKIKSDFFSKVMKDLRRKFSCTPLNINEITRKIMSLPNEGYNLFMFIADQSPNRNTIYYELEFLNQITPVYNGFDRISRKKDYAVVYLNMKKKDRGVYSVEFKEILPDEKTFKENEIVDKFFANLTENIKNQPSLWLWTHKRWKYKKGIHYNL